MPDDGTVPFPPETVITPDDNKCDTVDTEGGGAVVIYEHDGDEKELSQYTLNRHTIVVQPPRIEILLPNTHDAVSVAYSTTT